MTPYDIGTPYETVTVPAPVKHDDGLNRENIRRVRDLLAGLPPERFDMARYVSRSNVSLESGCVGDRLAECGTAGCIAGWTLYLLRPATELICWNAENIFRPARLALGLSDDAARELFLPAKQHGWSNAQAVAVLDHLIATGEVDWSVAERMGRDPSAATTSPVLKLNTKGSTP